MLKGIVLGVISAALVAAALVVAGIEPGSLGDLSLDAAGPNDVSGELADAEFLPPSGQQSVSVYPPAAATQFPALASQDRINILFLGLDNLDPKAPYRRSDAMIIVSLDPATRSAGMLSVPRDLYVTISGLKPPQKNRINAAYVFGDYYKYPGGGIALAMRTVQETLGISINHYVAVDYAGFVKAVDAIGGVDITLEKALSDPYLTKWSFPAGPQHLSGEQALRFARIRYMDNDFQRERRQQTLLLALRAQVLRAGMLPRLPALLSSLWGSFKTDMSPTDILALAGVAAEVDTARIHNHIIDETMVTPYRTPAGAAVLLPKPDAITKLVGEVLRQPALPSGEKAAANPTPTRQPLSSADLAAIRVEAARVELLNGTSTKGLAGRTQTRLQALGLPVTRVGDADRYNYTQTLLYVYVEKPRTRDALAAALEIRPENVRVTLNPKVGSDLRVILGSEVSAQ